MFRFEPSINRSNVFRSLSSRRTEIILQYSDMYFAAGSDCLALFSRTLAHLIWSSSSNSPKSACLRSSQVVGVALFCTDVNHHISAVSNRKEEANIMLHSSVMLTSAFVTFIIDKYWLILYMYVLIVKNPILQNTFPEYWAWSWSTLTPHLFLPVLPF